MEKHQPANNLLLLCLRKYLLLLAILAATVTYIAGLNPPGGVWLETTDGHLTGNQVLVVTYHARYNAFSYSNATAFMASAVVILLLLLAVKDKHTTTKDGNNDTVFVALRVVLALDMLALLVAYAAGASRDTTTTAVASALASPILLYVITHAVMDSPLSFCLYRMVMCKEKPIIREEDSACRSCTTDVQCSPCVALKRRRKVLMLLAIFATTITYTAGLNPPGGFWPETQERHRAGDPAMEERHWRRFIVFFVFNTSAFVASLGVIMLLLTNQFSEKWLKNEQAEYPQYLCIAVALLGLAGAYAAGTCRKTDSTTYVVFIYLCTLGLLCFAWDRLQRDGEKDNPKTTPKQTNENAEDDDGLRTARSLVLLLATLAATVTYQAGLNPPGGLWPDDRDGHKGGDPILLAKHATRYRVFFYCNSTALAASLVVIFMIQKNCLSKKNCPSKTDNKLNLRALEAVMILDLIGLIGAYAAGCCRDVSTSIYVIAVAGAVLVYVVFHLVFFTRHIKNLHEKTPTGESTRKLLLMLAILAATLTYQAGLTPPGGFWLEDDEDLGNRAGDPVLLSNYPRRYTAFFYLNATSFMASVALTVLLVNPNLYRAAINCHSLCVCAVAGLFSLMGAYTAGSSRHVRTSIYMIALQAGNGNTGTQDMEAGDKVMGAREASPSQSNEAGGTVSSSGNHGAAEEEENGNKGCNDIEPHKEDGVNGRDNEVKPPIATNGTEADVDDGTRRLEAADGTSKGASLPGPNEGGGNHVAAEEDKEVDKGCDDIIEPHTERRYLVLLAILAASVTYQAGLVPPGGFWPDNKDGHAAGNPVLHDSNHRRYYIFFYCNTTSFATSIAVIALLILELIHLAMKIKDDGQRTFMIHAAHYMMLVDLVGLLGAYASGSSREWETSGYIVAVVALVLFYIGLYITLPSKQTWEQVTTLVTRLFAKKERINLTSEATSH
ncbi:hypothetical protein HU200_048892 [Digitaria exilis]|uniref:PGG domain-containing protein n=1 Tax=Digitaria exilis TaxID=1010633 RepID=A0A835B5L9_9POAL|nr:hypothetical protein HU200_048892 [Digitaria exilis]